MKVKLLIFFALVFVNCHSQNRNSFRHYISSRYERYIIHEYTDENGNTVRNENITICMPLKAVVTLGSDGNPVIDFFSINNNSFAESTTCINSLSPLGTFKINLRRQTLGDPTEVIHIPFTALTYGVGTTAIRFRGKDNEGNAVISAGLGAMINTGFTIGYSSITHRKINNYSITAGPFIGIATADLIKTTVKNPDDWGDNKQINATLAYGLNVIGAINNFGIVLSLGFDQALGEERNAWLFNGKPWFGIGVTTGLGYF